MKIALNNKRTSQQKLVLSKFGLLGFWVKVYGNMLVTAGEPLALANVPMRYLKQRKTIAANYVVN